MRRRATGHPSARVPAAASPIAGVDGMTVSLSLVVILLAATYVLHRFFGLKIWHAVVCTILGLYLGMSKAGPMVRELVATVVGFLVALIP